jgi:hypothetical protein
MSNRQVGWATAEHQPYCSHSLFTLTLQQHCIVGMYTQDIQHAFEYQAIGSVISNNITKCSV